MGATETSRVMAGLDDGPVECRTRGNKLAHSSGAAVAAKVQHLRDLLAYEGRTPTRQFARALRAADLPGHELNLPLRQLAADGWQRRNPALTGGRDFVPASEITE